MNIQPTIESREVQFTLDVSARPAERLRVRKGQMVRVTTFAGEEILRKVASVSMPDERGHCTVYTEPA